MSQFSVTKQYKESVEGIFHGCRFSASVSPNNAKTGYRNSRVLRMAIYKKAQPATKENLIYLWDQKVAKVNEKVLSTIEINDLVHELNAL